MGERMGVRIASVVVLALVLSMAAWPALAGVQSDMAFITLTIYAPDRTLWYDTAERTQAVVEWRDANGGWHAVENWRATPSTALSWEVWPKDYGTGPFRWAVYAVYEGWQLLGASSPFYLPATAGQVVQVAVLLTRLPGGSAPPPPAPACTVPVSAEFQALWDANRGALGCAVSPAVTVATLAEEAFQGGHMFWRSDTDEVYVVYDRRFDGTALGSGYWWLNAAKWDGSYPDGTGMTPPPGLFEPKRGFGWVWRTFLGAGGGPLGWALDREYGFDNVGRGQRFERGVAFRGSDPRTYALLDNGTFRAR